MNLESTLLLQKTVFNVKKKTFEKAGTNIFLPVFNLIFFCPYKNVTTFSSKNICSGEQCLSLYMAALTVMCWMLELLRFQTFFIASGC